VISALEGFIERFIEKNALLIFGTSNAGGSGNGIFSPKMLENIKTKIFLPNPKANFDFKEGYALRESEYRQIKKLEPDHGEFLIKRGADAVVVKFDFKGSRQLSLLVSDASQLQLIDKAISETGSEEPEKWLPNYYRPTVK
jgi:type IV secretion system protein VirB4